MLKKIRSILKCFLFVELSSFVGRSIFIYFHYKKHPKYYAMQSAPWYTEIIMIALATSIIVVITLVAYWILGRIIKKNEQTNGV